MPVTILITLCCGIGYYIQHVKTKYNETGIRQTNLLEYKIVQYMEAIDYPLDSCLRLFSYRDSACYFKEISELPRLGLYIDARQCTSCWKKEIERLSSWADSTQFDSTPIILANNFNPREIKIMQNETELPIFSMGNVMDFMHPLTKFNVPFFFVIGNGTISRPLFPSEQLSASFYHKYISHVFAIIESRKSEYENNVTSITIHNPHLELGKVGMREKKTFVYRLRNNSNKPCVIYRCATSCSCAVVDSFSSAIAAGEEGALVISTVQNNKGTFNHGINIQTNFQEKPYTVTFSGYCE